MLKKRCCRCLDYLLISAIGSNLVHSLLRLQEWNCRVCLLISVDLWEMCIGLQTVLFHVAFFVVGADDLLSQDSVLHILIFPYPITYSFKCENSKVLVLW